MQWKLHRLEDGTVLLMMLLTRSEADEICNDMGTGDESPLSAKMAWHAFMATAENKSTHDSGE